MSLAAQAKVLRVLQEKKLSRVGSDKDIIVDVRVLAATNKDLKAEIEKGTFREDLYHRLSVIVLHVPSLDERRDDIPLLVKYFNDQVSTESGMPKKDFFSGSHQDAPGKKLDGKHPRIAQRSRAPADPGQQPGIPAGHPRLREYRIKRLYWPCCSFEDVDSEQKQESHRAPRGGHPRSWRDAATLRFGRH